MFLKCVIVLLQIIAVAIASRPLVTLKNGGQLEGIHRTTLRNRTFNAFLGVPYGTAKRFSNPEPAQPWKGVRDAGSPTPFCLQYNFFAALPTDPTDTVTGIEDCLLLDIATPIRQKCDSKLLPVVVMIPSGSFVSLGARAFGGKYMLDRDVVYVSINFRLGMFGFLSTGDSVIPGNYGLKDQSLALKWIRDNIEVFGGDPNSVTLVGDSSGAACVHYHYFSPLSRGLFHRGIAMSGSAGNYWATTADPKSKAQKLGTLLNCTNVEDSIALRECLLSKDGKELTAMYPQFISDASVPFPPVMEVKSSKDAFVTEEPLTMLMNHKCADLPLILSAVQGEGIINTATFLANPASLDALETSWNESAPTAAILDYQETVLPNKINSVSREIKNLYGINPVSLKTFSQLTQAIGDRSANADGSFTALLQAHFNKAPVYYNLFNYFGSASSGTLFGATLDQLRPYGPCHGDDVAYISNVTYLNTANTEQDITLINTMVDFVTSFATTGKPKFGGGNEWKPVSKHGLKSMTINYLKINSASDFKMEKKTNMGRSDFWHSLPLNEPIVNLRKQKLV